MLQRPFLFSLPAGLLTWVLIGALKSILPPNQTTDTIFDAFALPGALISGLVYPQGPHTGPGAPRWPGWALMVLISNLIVYALIWHICLRIIRRLRQKAEPRKEEPT